MANSDMENTSQNQTKASGSIGIMAVALIAVLAMVLVGYKSLNQPAAEIATLPTKSEQTQNSESTTELNLKPADAKYKDGVYDVVGEYVSPGGPETISVQLTLKDNLITDITVKPNATLEKSVMFQGIFVANYKPMVVGKSITELKLDKVAGSSLTPKGFNDALEKIKTSAQT